MMSRKILRMLMERQRKIESSLCGRAILQTKQLRNIRLWMRVAWKIRIVEKLGRTLNKYLVTPLSKSGP